MRHRDRHVDGQRVDVRNGRQHPELRARAHVVAHVCRGVGDDTVDGRAKLRIADVHAGAAEGLLGRADGGFGGFVLGRILIQLRLADGVDPGQRHGAVVVVAGFDRLRPGRLQGGLGCEHRGRKLVGVDCEQQLPALHGHTVGKLLRKQVAVHARLDHRIEIARQVTDELHAVGNAVRDGFGHADPERGHGGFGLVPAAPREEYGEQPRDKEKSVHTGMFYTLAGAKNVP